MAIPTVAIFVRLSLEHQSKLAYLAIKRSAELGRRVSQSFVISELIDQYLQSEDPDKSPETFGSRD